VWVPEDFNTDQFGTFTREKARRGTQLEVVRAKARTAMERYRYPIGIASEGSFAAHPQMPFLQSNLELVVLIDDTAGVEVVGQARSSTVTPKQAVVTSVGAAMEQANAWGFPKQGVILRANVHARRGIEKELCTWDELQSAVTRRLRWPWVRSLTLETDMRAHRCPARQETIAAATRDVTSRYLQRCPQCQAPGFVATGVARTATCALCQLPTDVPQIEVCLCSVCGYRVDRPISGAPTQADPGNCARCNP